MGARCACPRKREPTGGRKHLNVVNDSRGASQSALNTLEHTFVQYASVFVKALDRIANLMYLSLVNDKRICNTSEAAAYCRVIAQVEHTQTKAQTDSLTHNDGFAATTLSGAAQDVRKVLCIRRVVAINLLSCYSLAIMKVSRRFEESAIV